MNGTRFAEIEASVIRMYEQHPFPSIEDKAQKAEDEMGMRLMLLGIKPEDYVGKQVLDAGCGTGEYSCWYARRGAQVTAIDLSGPSLKIGAEYARKEGLTNIRFEKRSVLGLDLPDASFDYVYSMGVLHHTPDPYGGFQELCRVLRPGGIIMVSLYNRFGRLRHNARQFIVKSLAGDDIDQRVTWAKRLFPGTCRGLQRNRHDESDIILYDAFGIPHESQHTAGEVLRWFDHNRIDYLGSFGPLTVRDNLTALKLMKRGEFHGFKRFFDGYPLVARAVNILPQLVGRTGEGESREGDSRKGDSEESIQNGLTFCRPPWVSRTLVQSAWFLLGFRFSIFSMSGRKPGPGYP
jgi:2-polyprenyl-3-methyl-5-hydroxy-6-metoxy-1,4-benzoquinol methylase